MQASWRTDKDKLTFIICFLRDVREMCTSYDVSRVPINANLQEVPRFVIAGKADEPERMVGDVNLFLSSDEDDEGAIVGEVEIMIANQEVRGRGLGKEALKAFLGYVAREVMGFVEENLGADQGQGGVAESRQKGDEKQKEKEKGLQGKAEADVGTEKRRIKHFRARIGKDNLRSIRLFQAVGFRMWSMQPNYFGEMEMRLEGEGRGKWLDREGGPGPWYMLEYRDAGSVLEPKYRSIQNQ